MNDGPGILVYLGAAASAVMLFVLFLPWSAIVTGVLLAIWIIHSIANAPWDADQILDAELQQEEAIGYRAVVLERDVAKDALELNYNETIERMNAIAAEQVSEASTDSQVEMAMDDDTYNDWLYWQVSEEGPRS
jgi:divalent metal cation (Fe/Co/Zn/Cd) transporter